MTRVEEYERRLQSGDECERIYAAEDAGEARDVAGLEPLLKRLPVEPSRAVRGAIFRALEVLEADAVASAAIEMLSSSDAYLRNESVELLRRKGPEILPHLNRAFAHCGSGERKLILDAMTGYDSPLAGAILEQALSDVDTNVVITAVENIGQARRSEFRPAIEQLFDPGQAMLAASCLEALAEMGDARSVAAIQSRLRNGQALPAVLLPSYVKLLTAHGGELAAGALEDLLATAGGELRVSILEGLDRWHHRNPGRPLRAAGGGAASTGVNPDASADASTDASTEKKTENSSASGTGDRASESREGERA
jgi:HEAT repeat protein